MIFKVVCIFLEYALNYGLQEIIMKCLATCACVYVFSLDKILYSSKPSIMYFYYLNFQNWNTNSSWTEYNLESFATVFSP